MKATYFCAAMLGCAAWGGNGFAGDDVPGWLREVASAKTPAYESKVPAAVLLDEQTVTVDDSGRVVTLERRAVKILTREGRKDAVASTVYITGTGKVKEVRAWMIRPSGDVKKYGKEKVIDVALATNDVYNEVRARAVTGTDDADPGAVFGYEAVSESRSIFTQFEWAFQRRLPALLSRFSLTLPAGWEAKGVSFNGEVAPRLAGSTYTWECRNLPFIDNEPSSPSISSLAPRLAVSYFPAESAKSALGKVFAGWPDVSRWLAGLEDAQSAVTEEIAAKTRSLTSGAGSELDRIRAIGHYVQTVKYVSIQTGLGRGGGYRPHAAAEVFTKQYGDCKDKSTLMRAMLKAAAIESYPVSIWSGDPQFVREEWPSPQQFNHAIIAVRLSAASGAPAASLDHPKLGRLLFFDPTDENTPVGDLPQHEQGSLALIDSLEPVGLVRMPVIPATANRIERETELMLAPDGSIASKLHEREYGQSAARMRRRFRSETRADFTKGVERWLAGGVTGATIEKVEPMDAFVEDRFELRVEYKAERYAQVMRGRLLVFRPAAAPRRGVIAFSDAKRQYPVVLHPSIFEETIRAKLPAAFKIDEFPSGAKLETPYGSYVSSYKVNGDELVFTRKLEVKSATVPPGEYPAVKTFFEQVLGSEQAPLVLVKD